MGEYDTRPKRNLSTLLQMLDARGKTILEAWHTDVDGASFGQKEQNETGSFSDRQPFKRFHTVSSNRLKDDVFLLVSSLIVLLIDSQPKMER